MYTYTNTYKNQGYIEAHKMEVNRTKVWVLKYSLFKQ